jgi:hypothetical protein
LERLRGLLATAVQLLSPGSAESSISIDAARGLLREAQAIADALSKK